MKLSVVILTKNSAKYLREVLESTEFADETLVIDCGSSDETEKICTEFENVKFHFQKWLGFGAQKQFGVGLARNEWVFVLDSDEVILPDLKNEIIKTLENPEFKAYKVARLNYFFGREIRSMGLYPDLNIRLFNKKFAKFSDRAVHESIQTTEKIGILKNHFKHYAYESVSQFIEKQNRYSDLGAKRNVFKAIFSPGWTFFKLYILKGGFKCGFDGFVIAKLYAQYTFWKYVK